MGMQFRDKALKRFWETDDPRGLKVQKPAAIKLRLEALAAARFPSDLALSAWRWHPHRGKPQRWSIDLSGPWRIRFGWEDGNAIDVELWHAHR
jgi:toxin HigB-1